MSAVDLPMVHSEKYQNYFLDVDSFSNNINTSLYICLCMCMYNIEIFKSNNYQYSISESNGQCT